MKTLIPITIIFSLFLFTSIASSQTNCLTTADTNCDLTVNLTELTTHINAWYQCPACVPDIFQSMQAYYGIPFCGDWDCNAIIGEDCSSCQQDCGSCTPVPGPCDSITACDDYADSVNCSIDDCTVGGPLGCNWTGNSCEPAGAPLTFPTDYVSWWKFDGDAIDSGPGSNDGTFIGNATAVFDLTRHYNADTNGYVLSLDGTGDYASADVPELTFNNGDGYTILAWFKFNPTSAWKTVFDKALRITHYNRMGISAMVNANSYLAVYCGNTGEHRIYDDFTIWRHLAITMDSNKNVSAYIDGVQRLEFFVADNLSSGNERAFCVGKDHLDCYANGTIDDVIFFNRSLSAEEILQIYNAQMTYDIKICEDYYNQVHCEDDHYNVGGVLGCTWNSKRGQCEEVPAVFPIYWNFDGNVNDETGINNGTLKNGVTFTKNGFVNEAVLLDGMDDYIDFGNDRTLNMRDRNFSISFWFKKAESVDNYETLLFKATRHIQLSPGYGFYIPASWSRPLAFSISDGTNFPSVASPPVTDTDWHHAVAVRGGGKIKLYLDNVLQSEKDDIVGSVDNDQNFFVGLGGYASFQGPYAKNNFRGKIDELRIFNKALTVSEIDQMYQNDMDNHREPPSIILDSPSYGQTGVSTSPVLNATVIDVDGDTMDVSFFGSSTNASSDNFTIIALPDTQKYVNPGTYAHIFTNQTRWIVDNKDALNIVFVTHEGDIVDNPEIMQEWELANESMSLLDGVVPWGVLPGNHDKTGGIAYYYNQYFNYTRFEQYPWYGGHYGDDNNNNYQLFSAGGMDFIIIHLENDPSDDVLVWANDLLSTYSDRRAIIDSHWILDTSGLRSIIGEKIFNALKDNPNLFLMLCGHRPGEGRRIDFINNNTIHTLLSDYQRHPNGGNGYLRVMTFSPKENKIYVKTYSPYLDYYITYTSSHFTLDYQMTDYTEIGTNYGVTDGSTTMAWPGLAGGTKYYWYASAIDTNSQTSKSDAWSFTTA